MSIYLKFLRLFLVLIAGVFFLVGCEPDKDDGDKKIDSQSQNELSNNIENRNNQNTDSSSEDEDMNQDNSSFSQSEDNSTSSDFDNDINDNSLTESYQVYAERQLTINLNTDVYISNVSSSHGSSHGYTNDEEKKIYYIPKNGYIGKDEIKVNFYNPVTNIIYKVNVIEPPLEENRDFVIDYSCDSLSNHLLRVKSFDINIIDDDLALLESVHDDRNYGGSSFRKIPEVSKMVLEHYYSRWNTNDYSELNKKSVRHHNIFTNHINDNMMITCNYTNGYFSLIYPLDGQEWYATKPYNDNLTFSRNDLYFHVSSLSDLHSKIYSKEYQNGTSSENSYSKANQFMNKAFPNSHYTAELLHNYDRTKQKWIKIYSSTYINIADMFDKENKLYYDKIAFLADEVTEGNIPLLLQKIADNYESYYLSGNNQCLNLTICGTLFPEYTKSVTSNPKFENGLNSWMKREEFASPATGKIESFPTQNLVNIEYSVNRENSSENPNSFLDLYQIEVLNNNSIDDYFLRFDMNEVYGGASGHPSISGTLSSGFAGIYICYKDSNNEDIGCMAWSDHTNKFDIAWGVNHRINSSETFKNYRLQEVFRRVRPQAEQFVFTIHLGKYMQRYLPEIYKHKDKIKSMEYGLFATEFRSPDNACYHCEAKIKANEISLLKIK